MINQREVELTISTKVKIIHSDSLSISEIEKKALDSIAFGMDTTRKKSKQTLSICPIESTVTETVPSPCGQPLFNLHHDESSNVSAVRTTLTPRPGSFGADAIRAELQVYSDGNRIYVTANNPSDNEENPAVIVHFVEGELMASLCSGETNKRDPDIMKSINLSKFASFSH